MGSRLKFAAALVGVLLLPIAGTAATYHYVGQDFDHVGRSPHVPDVLQVGQRLEGWVTLAEPLGNDRVLYSGQDDVTNRVVDFRFTFGDQVLTKSSSYGSDFRFGTDSEGNIRTWRISAFDTPAGQDRLDKIGVNFTSIYWDHWIDFGRPGGQDQAATSICVIWNRTYCQYSWSESAVSNQKYGSWRSEEEIAPAPVPVPATLPLLASAIGYMGLRRRKASRKMQA